MYASKASVVVVAQCESARYEQGNVVVVAQLVEPWFVVPVVAGSSPVDHPLKKDPHEGDFF